MTKILTVFVLCAMLAGMILPGAVAAAGTILWTEEFDTEDPNNWLWEGSKFFVEDGVLKGWDEAKVHQSNFPTATGGTKKFKESAFKIDCIAYDDGGSDPDKHSMGLWWADYFDPDGTDNPTSWLVYKPMYCFETHTVYIEMEFAGKEGEAYKPAELGDDSVVFSAEVPASLAVDIGGDWFSLGMRVNAGVISVFYCDQKIVDFPAYRGALTGTERPSPVILLNGGCYCGFDNLVVATPDYNLFNESADAQQSSGIGGTGNNSQGANNSGNSGGNSGGNGGAKTRIETTIDSEIVTHSRVIGVDENGNEITTIESEIVTVIGSREVADTDTSGSSANRGGSATGDSAAIVIAVMVVALGSAVIVKKATER